LTCFGVHDKKSECVKLKKRSLSVQSSELKLQANVPNIGKNEAQHRKYKGIILGGGQAYDPSGV